MLLGTLSILILKLKITLSILKDLDLEGIGEILGCGWIKILILEVTLRDTVRYMKINLYWEEMGM